MSLRYVDYSSKKLHVQILRNTTTKQIYRERNGPAHTLCVAVDGTDMWFDIDLVFVLALDNSQWVSDRQIETCLLVGEFHLVPKPCVDDTSDGGLNWICSYAEIERKYINSKSKLKPLIRFFKVPCIVECVDYCLGYFWFYCYSVLFFRRKFATPTG